MICVLDFVSLVTEWVTENIQEDKPNPSDFRFLFQGKLLKDKTIILYELGLDKLDAITLVIEGRKSVTLMTLITILNNPTE